MSVQLLPSSPRSSTTRLTPQPRNPISLRLYKVLGTNFNDEATKEALRTLSDLYAAPASSTGPIKGKDVQRDNDEVDDEEAEDDVLWGKAPMTTAGEAFVESVPGESAVKARKNLRRDMENKLAAGSRQFLKAFGEVDQVGPLSYYICLHSGD